jgi:magnesium transporter
MRIFAIAGGSVTETEQLTGLARAPAGEPGYLWIACARREFEVLQTQLQNALQNLAGTTLVDLHVADLLNNQLPSHYDYTSQYDVLVFRRLAAGSKETDLEQPGVPLSHLPARGGPPILRRIDTSYAAKLLGAASAESRAAGARLPSGPADLMLRIVNHMVDGYLDLRRELTHQLDHWQSELLNPRTRFNNWGLLLDARLSLHHLDEICEDQRAALQDWVEALKTWPAANSVAELQERELLHVRSRDVLEHIERVVHHVRRLEQSAETAVQMHFNAQSHRTNEIMRTLTVLTAVFLPLNLIAGIFGMNFEFIPLLHLANGFWICMALMLAIAGGLVVYFWRKRFIEHDGR